MLCIMYRSTHVVSTCTRLHCRLPTPFPTLESVAFSGFGVFDGHGGSKSATFCAKHLLENVMAYAARPPQDPPQPPPVHPHPMPPAANEAAGADDALELLEQPSAAQQAAWEAQDALIQRLPKVTQWTCERLCTVMRTNETSMRDCRVSH